VILISEMGAAHHHIEETFIEKPGEKDQSWHVFLAFLNSPLVPLSILERG
jgi:hypothetical protein